MSHAAATASARIYLQPAVSSANPFIHVHPVMSTATFSCTIVRNNPDISGVGVRISFYLQSFLLGSYLLS
jgi:hypothetical protein